MNSEEKVLDEIRKNIDLLFHKIAELKVAEEERKAFEKEKADFQLRIDDYKKHKLALDEREHIKT